MSFLDRPWDHLRTARSSRDVCRDAVAIEPPVPRRCIHSIALVALGCLIFAGIGALLAWGI